MSAQSSEVTRPEKVLFPEAEVTKADLAAYFDQVAEVILPHLAGRPLVLRRYPTAWTARVSSNSRPPSASRTSSTPRQSPPTTTGATYATWWPTTWTPALPGQPGVPGAAPMAVPSRPHRSPGSHSYWTWTDPSSVESRPPARTARTAAELFEQIG